MCTCKVGNIMIENVPSLPLVTKGFKMCVMFGVHILGSVHHNRIYTLPTPGPKGPTDKASYILGVVSFGVQTIGSEDHNITSIPLGLKGPHKKSLMFWVQ